MKPIKVWNLNIGVKMKPTGVGMKDHEQNLFDGFCFEVDDVCGCGDFIPYPMKTFTGMRVPHAGGRDKFHPYKMNRAYGS